MHSCRDTLVFHWHKYPHLCDMRYHGWENCVYGALAGWRVTQTAFNGGPEVMAGLCHLHFPEADGQERAFCVPALDFAVACIVG